jgi:hypothetical protein
VASFAYWYHDRYHGESHMACKACKVLEKNGGDDGTLTRGLCRDSTPFGRN